MKIIKKVLIKQVITEKSKEKLQKKFSESKIRLEQECQRLRFEQRKLENKGEVSIQDIAKRFQREINKRKEKMQLADFKIEQLDVLELGSEITEKEVEALVEVGIGSHWDEIMGERAIVIRDDFVIRIDN